MRHSLFVIFWLLKRYEFRISPSATRSSSLQNSTFLLGESHDTTTDALFSHHSTLIVNKRVANVVRSKVHYNLGKWIHGFLVLQKQRLIEMRRYPKKTLCSPHSRAIHESSAAKFHPQLGLLRATQSRTFHGEANMHSQAHCTLRVNRKKKKIKTSAH
jgi:hypothetical protein